MIDSEFVPVSEEDQLRLQAEVQNEILLAYQENLLELSTIKANIETSGGVVPAELQEQIIFLGGEIKRLSE
jgi:hypothetical protein